jgi:zinc-binding alcohol dehydrogenase family protein
MRALLLESPSPVASAPLRLVELHDPAPAPGELLLRVAACAVCRTDLQIAEGDLAAHRLPVVLGHQAVGKVEALGAGVTDWKLGERAGVTWLAGFDGHCPRCLEGRENLCPLATFTGWDRDGGFAELMTVRADVAVRVPRELDDVAAAPLLCGGVIGYRSLGISGVQPGGRLGLYGFGASARLTIQVAVHRGCRVFVATRSEDAAAPSRSAPSGPAATTTPHPSRSTPRSRSHLRAMSSSRRCGHSTGEERSPSTQSTSIACPSSPTTSCGGSAACAASRTSRGEMRASSSSSQSRFRSRRTSRSIRSPTATSPCSGSRRAR